MTPPVAGTVFAVTFAFMLLLPFVRLSLAGSGEPETLLFLTKTDFGLNIFALVLFLVPIAGVAVSLFLRAHLALLVGAVLAAIGVVMIPLTILTVGHLTGSNASLSAHVGIGVGVIPVSIMLIVLVISSAIAVFQTRR